MRNRGTSPLSASPRQSLTGEPPWTLPDDDRPDFSALKENIHKINKYVPFIYNMLILIMFNTFSLFL